MIENADASNCVACAPLVCARRASHSFAARFKRTSLRCGIVMLIKSSGCAARPAREAHARAHVRRRRRAPAFLASTHHATRAQLTFVVTATRRSVHATPSAAAAAAAAAAARLNDEQVTPWKKPRGVATSEQSHIRNLLLAMAKGREEASASKK